MRKRPLFTGALFLALLLWILTGALGLSFGLEKQIAEDRGTLSGVLWKVEEKETKTYLYLKNACFRFGAEEVRFAPWQVLLTAEKDEPELSGLRLGNRIEGEVFRCGFSVARNDGNFDEAAYDRSLGISEKFELQSGLRVTDMRILPLRQLLFSLRLRIQASVREVADARTAGVIEAVLTGGREGLSRETKELYQKSGIAHILAISGLHISLFGSALLSLLRKRLRPVPAAVTSGLVMILFCIMCGESPSAVRAVLMFLLRLLALCLGKSFDLLNALGAAAIALLCKNPMYLYHSGFQLSFGAVLGIGLLQPAFVRCFPDEGEPALFFGQVKAAFFASLSVTLFTLPLVAGLYDQVPLFSVLLNLLVVPLMSFVLEGGMAGAAFGLLGVFFGRLLMGLSVYLVTLIEWLCALLDRIPFSVVVTGHLSPVRVGVYYLILGFFLLLSKRKELLKARLFRTLLLPVLVSLLCLPVFLPKPRPALEITFLDVDQGDSILFTSPSGKNYLIDGGSSSVSELYRYRLESALKYKGISRLDVVFLTHPDTDHISAVLSMLEAEGAGCIRIQSLLLPFVPDNENFQTILQDAKAAGVSVTALHAGMTLDDGALSFRCLHPDAEFSSDDANAYSAVLELRFGSFRALFTGDLPEEEEQLLLARERITPCQVLKVAHHGSRYSTTERFLKAVQPEAAIISAGVKNRYGHPHPEVLERLGSIGAETFVTAERGAVTLSASPDGTFRIRTRLPRPEGSGL